MNALIMAGGSGSRFWPLSRLCRPKQFLPLWGDETLLAQTVRRLEPITPNGGLYIVTGREYREMTLTHAPNIQPQNMILEPFGRNTAPAIGLASIAMVKQGMGSEVVVVCPADHLISDEDKFRQTLEEAHEAASRGRLVVIGVAPLEPSPHYGYIERGEASKAFAGLFAVKRFVEKPSRSRAEQMLEAGEYFWNAGIFMWTPESILSAIQRHMPELSDGLNKISDALGTPDESRVIEEVYHGLPSMPIDIGVLERSDRLAMIPARMDWCDVGNWSSLRNVLQTDGEGNVRRGKTVSLGSRNCLLWSNGRLLATIGMEGVAVVETDDAVLVCSLDRDQDLKELLEKLDREGYGNWR